LNRRCWRANQFVSYADIEKIIGVIHECGRKVMITFNAHYYTDKQLKYAENCLRTLAGIGIDGLIIADTALLPLLAEWGLNFNVHISGEAGVYSSLGARFFKKFGVSRIIFPRDITLGEIEEITGETKELNMEYEVFVMAERCLFSGAYCRTTHGFTSKNFCSQSWVKSLYARLPEGAFPSAAGDIRDVVPRPGLGLLTKWYDNAGQYRIWAGEDLFRNISVQNYVVQTCGLCAIPALKSAGVTTLKVVSRGVSVNRKLRRLRLVKRVLDNIDAAPDYCQRIIGAQGLCRLGYMCYYPEAKDIPAAAYIRKN
jgi:collagenase-like PrtC family protease